MLHYKLLLFDSFFLFCFWNRRKKDSRQLGNWNHKPCPLLSPVARESKSKRRAVKLTHSDWQVTQKTWSFFPIENFHIPYSQNPVFLILNKHIWLSRKSRVGLKSNGHKSWGQRSTAYLLQARLSSAPWSGLKFCRISYINMPSFPTKLTNSWCLYPYFVLLIVVVFDRESFL